MPQNLRVAALGRVSDDRPIQNNLEEAWASSLSIGYRTNHGNNFE
jgi:hypothetical protein